MVTPWNMPMLDFSKIVNDPETTHVFWFILYSWRLQLISSLKGST